MSTQPNLVDEVETSFQVIMMLLRGHANYCPPPSTAVQYRVVMVKYCYVIAIDVILYIVTNPACHQRNKSNYMDRGRLVGWLVSYVNNVAP